MYSDFLELLTIETIIPFQNGSHLDFYKAGVSAAYRENNNYAIFHSVQTLPGISALFNILPWKLPEA